MTGTGMGLTTRTDRGATVWRHELVELARLATPIVLTQLAWVSMLTTDTAMIGRLGPDALAGASLSLMIFFLAWVFCFGIVMATASLAAQAYGAHRPRTVRRVVRQGLWVTIVLTVPWVVAFRFTPDLLVVLGQPAEVLVHAEAYMSTLMWCLPPAIGFAVLRNFVSAVNRPASAFWVMLAGVPINALLDYVLIFGAFGLPRLELVGAGLATSIVNLAMFLALLAIAVYRRPFARYAVLNRFLRTDWQTFRHIFRIGLPIAGTMLLEAGFFIGAVFVMGQFGAEMIAAHMIAIQLPHITFMVPMGLGQAATVRVGHAVGRRDVDGVRRAGWTALAMTLLFMTIATAVILAVPEAFASVFMDGDRADSAAVLALATGLLFYAAIFQVADGLQAVAAGVLRGLNDTAIPMVLAAVSYWGVGVSTGLWLAFGAEMEGAGLWLGFVLGLCSAAVLLTLRFQGLTRRRYLPAAPGAV